MASIPAKSGTRDQGVDEGPRPDSRRPTAHLTGRIAAGDEAAFAGFYEAWFDRVFAMARAMSRRDEAFCLDVVQDCMMRVVRGMKPLSDERAVSAWMGKAVFSTIADRIRVERRRAGREQVAARPDVEVADVDLADRIDWLRVELADLPECDRRLILDRFEQGDTLAAVGARHGISGNAAHGRIFRILGRLRQKARELFHD